MLQRQNYKQFIQQQGLIQTTIAEGWGYNVNPKQFLYQQPKLHQQTKVAMIEPMRKKIDIPISKKLQKIEDELLMLENQRKLNRLTQQAKKYLQSRGEATNNECAAVKMMQKRVQEYNFIIDHRHILEKNSKKARSILGISKTKAQMVNQEVQALKDKLPESSFTQMIQINKKIAQLYRNYEKTIFSSKQTTERNESYKPTSNKRSHTKRSITTYKSLQNSAKLESQVKIIKNSKLGSKEHSQATTKRKEKSSSVSIKDLVIMQELNQSSQGDSSAFDQINIAEDQIKLHPQSLLINFGRPTLKKRISESPYRKRIYTVMQKQKSVQQMRKEKIKNTIAESFIKRQMLEKGQALDKRLRQNEDVIDVWRQRIDQNKQRNNLIYRKPRQKAKEFKDQLRRTNKHSTPLQSDEKVQQLNKAHEVSGIRMKQVRNQMKEKEKMFAILVRKKQSKFSRVPGTQIMQLNDAVQTAKRILGVNKTNPHLIQKNQQQKEKMNRRKSTTQADEPEWLNIQNNQELYWSMCRNEKLNILLKKSKK